MTVDELIRELRELRDDKNVGNSEVQFPNMEIDDEVSIHELHYWRLHDKVVFNKKERR